jgi:hypothetical protein
MKNATIQQAINFGFDFDQFHDPETTMQEVYGAVVEFMNSNWDLIPNFPTQEDECEVSQNGRGQNVNYGDFTSSGEIINWSDYRFQDRKKVYHSAFVAFDEATGEFYVMKLWCWSKDEETETI